MKNTLYLYFLLKEENRIEIAAPTGGEIAVSDKRQHMIYYTSKGLEHWESHK